MVWAGEVMGAYAVSTPGSFDLIDVEPLLCQVEELPDREVVQDPFTLGCVGEVLESAWRHGGGVEYIVGSLSLSSLAVRARHLGRQLLITVTLAWPCCLPRVCPAILPFLP